MFNLAEKVVLTLLSSFILLFVVALDFRVTGFTEISDVLLCVGLATFGAGVVFGFVALVKYLWFDA